MTRHAHVMIDIETLSTRPTAAVVAIGAVAFDPDAGPDAVDPGAHGIEILVRPTSGRGHIDPDTLAWWVEQSEPARQRLAAAVFKGVTLPLALFRLSSWFHDCVHPEACVWAHGAGFDPPILEHHFGESGIVPPWNYRRVRDTRTLYMLASDGVAPEIPFLGTPHSALDDAAHQARQVCVAFAR